MLNVRLLMLSALMLAMAGAMFRSPQIVPARFALPEVDWGKAEPVLACPSNLPEHCTIPWGP